MNLKDYFENTKGIGVLSTANQAGEVDAAIYARPYVYEDGTIGFIMRNRLSHENLKTNPHAAYLFIEQGNGYKGKRLLLTKVGEETDAEMINRICRRCYLPDLEGNDETRFVVVFKIDKELPLIGSGD